MSFGSRLKERREELGLKQGELGKLLGVTGSAIGNYENGVSSPKAEILYQVFDVLKCDANYLFQDEMKELETEDFTVPEIKMVKKYRALDEHGKGTVNVVLDWEYSRCATLRKEPAKQNRILRIPKGKRSNGDFTEVDVYDEPSAAGLGNYVDSASPHHLEQYPTEIIPSKTDFGVLISGSSMEPKIPNGSTVFVQAAPALDSGEIGIFVLDGQAYCKKFVIDHDTHRTLLRSINPHFEDMEIKPWADEFRTLGRVLAWYTPKKFDND